MERDVEDDSGAIHYNKLPRKIYVTKSFPPNPNARKLRFVSQVTDVDDTYSLSTIENELVLTHEGRGRFEIRATVIEDDRGIKMLRIQKFDSPNLPSKYQYFDLGPTPIQRLLGLLETIKTMPMETGEKFHLTAFEAGSTVLDQDAARKLFGKNQELFVRIAEDSDLQHDLVALGYRRKTIATFERMLKDSAFFAAEEKRSGLKGEAVWQAFFEANTWIFGYGLAYQFLGKLDEGKLERSIVGSDVAGRGKRGDGIMKTQARINSLCFVEVKMHDAALVSIQYRGDGWLPGKEVAGGVAQIQATIQGAIERYTPRLIVQDEDGNPTAEPIFNIDPRAFLVVGDLSQFQTEHGVNLSKFRSFESYRRNIRRPEIVTFDELLDRARFIVEHEPSRDEDTGGVDDDWDDVPF